VGERGKKERNFVCLSSELYSKPPHKLSHPPPYDRKKGREVGRKRDGKIICINVTQERGNTTDRKRGRERERKKKMGRSFFFPSPSISLS
jgi:hypothetical protein